MNSNSIVRDERTTAVEGASFRWAYLIMSYGLLASIMYRSFVIHESTWDLMSLVIVGGAVASLYQGQQRVLSTRWTMLSAASVVIAVIIAIGFLFMRR